ncbi:hypothetical protein CM1200mP19_1760 [bacterium]|nr:MAG: hypothetical protein CM1200mP19_1760 [bacterium]
MVWCCGPGAWVRPRDHRVADRRAWQGPAVAKGVRKTRSKFGVASSRPATWPSNFHRGRGDLDIVTQAETLDRFEGLRLEPKRFAEASSLLEAIDVVAPDREPDRERYRMLVGALRTLNEGPGPALVVSASLSQTPGPRGPRPAVGPCVRCGVENRWCLWT